MELTHFESLYPKNTREKEIEKVLSFIKQGNSPQVVSLSGVGRSNFLGLFSYNKNIRAKHLGENKDSLHFVLINFSEVRRKPLKDVFKFIFLEILDSLRERGFSKRYEEVNKIFKQSSEFNDEMVLFQGLKKTVDFLCIEKNLTLVLLFDRFEEYVPNLTQEFFANLRVLRNRAKFHFCVVFSLSRPLEDLVEPSLFADFFEFVAGRIVYLPIYDKEGLDFRISHLEKRTNKKFNTQVLKKIMKLTAGHGRLFILCLEAISEILENIPKNDLQLVDFLLTKRPIRSAFFAIWNALTPSEQQFFIDNKKEPIFLEKIGICLNGNTTIPLFDKFIKKEIIDAGKLKELKKEEIEFVEELNEIKKGDVIISDSLTSSEFRLLKFLIINKNKISEKEAVIEAVWGDKTTTLGVTDQALDQLVFRLRKKIEIDPTYPKHILTVKGRGFKFFP